MVGFKVFRLFGLLSFSILFGHGPLVFSAENASPSSIANASKPTGDAAYDPTEDRLTHRRQGAAWIGQLDNPNPNIRRRAAMQLRYYPTALAKQALQAAIEGEVSRTDQNEHPGSVAYEMVRTFADWCNNEDISFLESLNEELQTFRKEEATFDPLREFVPSVILRAKETGDRPLAEILEGALPAEQKALRATLARLKEEAQVAANQDDDTGAYLEAVDHFSTMITVATEMKLISEDAAKLIHMGTESALSDDFARFPDRPTSQSDVRNYKDAVGLHVLKALVAGDRRLVVINGPAGVGKSEKVQEVLDSIWRKTYPPYHLYENILGKGHWHFLRTTAAQLMALSPSPMEAAQALAIRNYFNALLLLQTKLARRIIVVIDGIEHLPKMVLQEIIAQNRKTERVLCIGEAHPTIQPSALSHPSVRNTLDIVDVAEPSREQVFQKLKERTVSDIQHFYRVALSDSVLRELISSADENGGGVSRPEAQIKYIDAFANFLAQKKQPKDGQLIRATLKDVYQFESRHAELPVNPKDLSAFDRHVEKAKRNTKKKVVSQDHIVDAIGDWIYEAFTAPPEESIRSVMVLGSTGTGKTFAIKTMAYEILGEDTKRLHKVDGNRYSDKNPMAAVQIIADFTDILKKESGSYAVILLDESDKMAREAIDALMELMDQRDRTGGIRTATGELVQARHVLLAFTSNRGIERIFNSKASQRSRKKINDDAIGDHVKNMLPEEKRSVLTQAKGYGDADRAAWRPETAGRLNDILIAKPASEKDIIEIASREFEIAREKFRKRPGLDVRIDTEVVETLGRSSFTFAGGARPIRDNVVKLMNQVKKFAFRKKGAGSIQLKLQRVLGESDRVLVYRNDRRNKTILGEVELKNYSRYMAVYDPKFLERLDTLADNLKKANLGQEELAEDISAQFKAHATLSLSQRPMTYLIDGSAEVAEKMSSGLAEFFFGSGDRQVDIDLSSIEEAKDLWSVFGSGTGYVGSNEDPRLVTFLKAHQRTGGIIRFKNFTRMGAGKSAEQRRALFNQFDGILNEGRWTNIHGEEFTFENCGIIFQEEDVDLYKQYSDENVIQFIWAEEENNRRAIQESYVEKGVPLEVLQKIRGMARTKPTTAEVKQKLMVDALAAMNEEIYSKYGFRVGFSDRFVKMAADGYFPAREGERGMSLFVDQVSAFIADEALPKILSLRRQNTNAVVDLELDLTLNVRGRPWAAKKAVKPMGRLHLNGRIGDQEIQTTKKLAPSSLPEIAPYDESYWTLIHEAIGHAMVDLHLDLPLGPLIGVTVKSDKRYGGAAFFDNTKQNKFPGYSDLLKQVAAYAAGRVAEEVYGNARNAGASGDYSAIRSRVQAFLLDWAIVPGTEFLFVKEAEDGKKKADPSQLPPALKKELRDRGQKIVELGIELARRVITHPKVQEQAKQGVDVLKKHGAVTSKQFLKAIGPYRIPASYFKKYLKGCPSALE